MGGKSASAPAACSVNPDSEVPSMAVMVVLYNEHLGREEHQRVCWSNFDRGAFLARSITYHIFGVCLCTA